MALKTRKPYTDDISEQAEILASELAEKPYGQPAETPEGDMIRTSISLPQSTLDTIEDLARNNKRAKKDPKSVSAIIRLALDEYLTKIKK